MNYGHLPLSDLGIGCLGRILTIGLAIICFFPLKFSYEHNVY